MPGSLGNEAHKLFLQRPNQPAQYTKEATPQSSVRAYLSDPPGHKALVALSSLFARLFMLLDELHQLGTLHRALRPGCLWLFADGALGISDFRFEYRIGEERSDALPPRPSEAYGYFPPEQALTLQDAFEPRSDLFSLGAILYEAITGQRAFPGGSPVEILAATLDRDPLPPRQLNPACPEALEQLCLQLLQKKVEERPGSAAEVAHRLRAVFSGKESAAAPEAFEIGTAPTAHLQAALGATVSGSLSQKSERSSSEIFGTGPTLSVSGPSINEAPRSLVTVPREHYAIEGEIARGGLGKIIKARDTRLGREVAVKELLQDQGKIKARFLREASITAQLQHPGIVPIYEAGVWPTGEPFYVMKLIAGKPFDKVIKETTTFPERLALLPRVIAASEALAYAHANRVIHRDLKPHNMIIGEYGETIVIDWGLAKVLDGTEREEHPAEGPYHEAAPHHLTQTGEIMGTPAYMPLEQAQGKPVDARSDVYSLGAILYHLLSGRPPYLGKKSVSVLKSLLDNDPTPLEQLAPETPKDLLAIVKKAMARQAEDRYQTAKELVEDLKNFQTGQLVGAHQYTGWELMHKFYQANRAVIHVIALSLSILSVVLLLGYQRLMKENKRANDGWESAKQNAKEKEEARLQTEELLIQQKALTKKRTFDSIQGFLSTDPKNALGLLREVIDYPEFQETSYPEWGKVRTLAADAISRGVPRTLTTRPGLGAKISPPLQSVEFSPDGAFVLALADNENIYLWDTQTWSYRTLEGHTKRINKAYFSLDGSYIISYAQDGTLRKWETATGAHEIISDNIPISDYFFEFNFIPSKNIITIIGIDKIVRFWNLADRSYQELLEPDYVNTTAFSPDGNQLAIAEKNIIFIVDLSTKARKKLSSEHRVITKLTFTPDGNHLLVAGFGKSAVQLIDCNTGEIQSLLMGDDVITDFTYQDPYIVMGSFYGNVYIFKDNLLIKTVKAHETEIEDVQISIKNDLIATAGEDKTARLISLSGNTKHTLQGHQNIVRSVSFSSDGKYIASASKDGYLMLWDIFHIHGVTFNIKEAPVVKKDQDFTTVVEISPDGKTIATGTPDGVIHLWDCASRKVEFLAQLESKLSISKLSFSPDGKFLASSSDDGNIFLWDLTNKNNQLLFNHTKGANSVIFSKSGRYLASVGIDKNVWLYDTQNKEGKVLTGHKESVWNVAFSPEEDQLATVSSDKTVILWDIPSLSKKTLEVGSTYIFVLFYKDKLILSGGSNSIDIWSITNNKKEFSLEQHLSTVTGIALSPDQNVLASTSWDGTVRFWDLKTKESRAVPLASSTIRLAYFPQGDAVALTSVDGMIHIIPDDLPTRTAELSARIVSLSSQP